MMHKWIEVLCLVLGIFLAENCYAQNKKESKSSSYKMFRSRSLSSDVPALLQEADNLKQTNPGEALNKVQDALGLSIAQQDEFSEAKCYVLLGEINEGIQEWKLALENYDRAYQKLAEHYVVTDEYKRSLQGLGTANLMLEKYEDALKYLLVALSVSKDRNSKYSESYYQERLIDLSEVYYKMGNFDEAIRTLDPIPSRSNTISSSFDARVENQKAKIYARMNEMSKSKVLYDNSINSLRSNKKIDAQQTQSLQNAKEDIADALHEQNRYDEEINLRNKAITYNLESKNMEEVTKDKVAIGKTLEAKGDTRAAIKEMEEAAAIADTLDNPKEQANAFLALAALYEKNGRTNQALTAYKKYSLAIGKSVTLKEAQLDERSKLINKQKDIDELTKDVSIGQREETIELGTVFRQQLIIYGLLFIILVVVIASYFIYKNARASKLANQMLALKSLRGQMNPHFIFNALNSVNHFIAQQDERTANKFLSDFSQLMRFVLENSQEDFISLGKEQEILSLYLKLEHYRFRDKFDYEIEVDKEINADVIEVPPMLIQPYIENAVWHGLRYKESKGKLALRFHKEQNNLIVEITDNGIGRQKSAELKTENQRKHNSTGLKNIQERLAIINKVYKSNYRVSIEDLAAGAGTRVRIFLPVNRSMNGV